MNASERKGLTKDESQALLGLRGLLAVHIMLFHSVIFSKLQWNLVGSSQMPIFFLISGFFLAYTSGKFTYGKTPCCHELFAVPEDEVPPRMNAKHFWRRRISRTIPLHYLCNFASIPLTFGGYGWVPNDPWAISIAVVLMLTCTATWLFIPVCIDGPSWFISTLWFYYYCFPSLLPKLQAYSLEEKLSAIWRHYWYQGLLGWIIFLPCVMLVGWWAFFIATFWPPSRFPVFIMGVFAGLLRLQSPHSYKPRSSFLLCCQPHTRWSGLDTEWAAAVDRESLIVTIAFLIVGIGEVCSKELWGLEGIGSGIWFQFMLPLSQLTIVYGLSMDNGLSRTSKILRSKVGIFFGNISFSLYLVHQPIRQYICWIVYGTQTEPTCDYESSEICKESWELYNWQRLQPLWCIPVHSIVSIVLAVFLYHLVEKPARNHLLPKNAHQYEPKRWSVISSG